MTTRHNYRHHRAMKRHGISLCRVCEGDWWLDPVCEHCTKGYVHTEEANTHYRLIRRVALAA